MPSTTQVLSRLNLPKAPIMSQNKATVVLTNESMAKFQAQMADLASLIDSYHTNPNETTKAACDEMLRTALAGLPAESRENAMQHTPPRVYSYYQESFKNVKTSGNDKKEALIQAQIHQDQQQVLTAQQIAQIKLQAAKDYSDFWSKHNEFDWKKASAEEMRKWREKDAQMEAQWRAEEAKKLQNLPLEEAKLRATMLNNQRIEDNNRVINACQDILKNPTASPDKKAEAKQLLEVKIKSNINARKQNEGIKNATTTQDVVENFSRLDAGNVTGKINTKGLTKRQVYMVKIAEHFQKDPANCIEATISELKNLDKENFNKKIQQLTNDRGEEYDQKAIDKMKASYDQLNKERYDQFANSTVKEKQALVLKSIQEVEKIAKEQAENTSLSEKERKEFLLLSSKLHSDINEVVHNSNTDQDLIQMAGIDVSKYQADNQEKAQDSNEQSTTEQKADKATDKATDNTEKAANPAAPKVPNENNANNVEKADTSDKTAETESPAAPKVPEENNADNTENAGASDNTTADTHSNAEESGKTNESGGGLTTLKLAGTQLVETNEESNYLLNRTNGAELA